MRKIVFALLAMMALGAFAQPKKITAPEGTFLWGYYNGKEFSENPNLRTIGYGMPDEYYIGINVPATSELKGNKIKGVVVPVVDNSCIVGDYKVEVYNGAMDLLGSQAVDPKTLKSKDFNYIMFEEPVTIDRAVTVCTHFTTTGFTEGATYPAYYDGATWVNNSFLFGNGTEWADYGSQFGCYAMMLIVGGLEASDIEAYFTEYTNGYTLADQDNTLPFTLTATSGVAVTEIEYTLSINGGAAETRKVAVDIPAGAQQTTTLDVTFRSPAEKEDYMLDLVVTKVNGQDNPRVGQRARSFLHNVSRIPQRRVVMEEFTGTYCGWCPRGYVGMNHCNEQFGDKFIGIAIHQYNSSDPMYIDYYHYPLYFAGAPSCYMDRTGGTMDPYFGSAGYGSKGRTTDDVAAHLLNVPTVDVSAKAEYVDETMTQVKVDARLDAIADGSYDVVFVLTADGLEGKGFEQGNYYYSQYKMTDYPDDPDLASFCEGGERGMKWVSLVYDDIAIATSYNEGVNQGEQVIVLADGSAETSFTLDIPTSNVNLMGAIQNAGYKVNAVVLLINGDKTIANAYKVPVQVPSAISNVVAPKAETTGKYLQNGQIIIRHNGKNYTPSGLELK